MSVYDLLIVGSGPSGLSTAIAASRRKLSYLVLEKGALVNTILNFPRNMVFFTTPELLEIGGIPFTTPYDKPTRLEALQYYRKVTDALQLTVAFGETVTGVRPDESAVSAGGERTLVVSSRSADGLVQERRARSVVLASGAYDHPNVCGIPGEDLPHVSHYYSEPHPFFRKQVVIVGGQNSAAETALDLFRSGASKVTIVYRGKEFGNSIKYWVKPDLENRVKAGSIAARFQSRVVKITPTTVTVASDAGEPAVELPADAVFLLTGYHSDERLLQACGIRYDPETLEPAFDPETFESNVPGLYLAGQVITGRNSGRIFIENGRFHGERVVEVIAQRLASGALVSPA